MSQIDTARRVRLCYDCAYQSQFLYGRDMQEVSQLRLIGCTCDSCGKVRGCSTHWFDNPVTPPPVTEPETVVADEPEPRRELLGVGAAYFLLIILGIATMIVLANLGMFHTAGHYRELG